MSPFCKVYLIVEFELQLSMPYTLVYTTYLPAPSGATAEADYLRVTIEVYQSTYTLYIYLIL